jgi:hypothetical protein
MDNFKSFKVSDLNPEKRTVQKNISYYLCNNIVPGFNHDTFDGFKKDKIFISPDLYSSRTYKVDKWYFVKKDDLNIYYEKFFLDKVKYFIIQFYFRKLINEERKMLKKKFRWNNLNRKRVKIMINKVKVIILIFILLL